MNVIWRTLIWMIRARYRLRKHGKVAMASVGVINLRTLPTDIDLLGHMNNGRYLSLFDLGRWEHLVRTGVFDAMRKNRWYAVVASASVTFRKSLNLGQKFELHTRFIGHDDRSLYLEHRAVVGGEIYARAIMRARVLRQSGGTVSNDEVFAAMGKPDAIPEIDPWIHDWAKASALPPFRESAPNTWG